MNKTQKSYLTIWAICLLLFNIITFAVISATIGLSVLSPSFWIGYIFITLMFVANLVCSYMVLKEENSQKLFYNMPILKFAYSALVVSVIVGTIAMAVPFIPYWVGIVVDAIVVAFYAIKIVTSKTAADVVTQIDEKVKQQTFFIKSITVDADSLMSRAQNNETKAVCKKVYEAFRYSDPMSNDQLADIENQIQNQFNAFANAVKSDDTTLATSTAEELLNLISDRNKKCKVLK